jgi:hypothetical protein
MDANSGADTGRNTTASQRGWIDAWLPLLPACLPACHGTQVYMHLCSRHMHRSSCAVGIWMIDTNWFSMRFADLSLCRRIALSPRKNAVGVVTWEWLCRPVDPRTMSAPSMQGQSRLSRNLDRILRRELLSSKGLVFWFETILTWNKEQRLWNIIHWNPSHQCPGRTGG